MIDRTLTLPEEPPVLLEDPDEPLEPELDP
jgi:hypothetical protein